MGVKPPTRAWVTAGLPAGAHEALAHGLAGSRLWSLLLDVFESRAGARTSAALLDQWDRDRFVKPAPLDQRTLLEVDRHLHAAAEAFETIELSPVAPLGVCSVMGRTSQNKVLSALRGTEIVADPTNVMALECGRRLRRDPATVVRLATSHRCLRAQEVPTEPGFAAHFRIFCLAGAGLERPDHGLLVDAFVEQVLVMLDGLNRLARHGFAFPDRRITVLANERRSALRDRIADRIGAAIGGSEVGREALDHPYYDGLRFQIAARSSDGVEMPIVDGGVFDWVATLVANRGAVFVASGLGSQLVPMLFRSTLESAP